MTHAERLTTAEQSLQDAELAYSENPAPAVWKTVTTARESLEQASLAKAGADRKAAKEAEEAAAAERAAMESRLADVVASLEKDVSVEAVADKLFAALATITEAGKEWAAILEENRDLRDQRSGLRQRLGLLHDGTGQAKADLERRLARKLGAKDSAATFEAMREAMAGFDAVVGRARAESDMINEQKSRLRSDLGRARVLLKNAEEMVERFRLAAETTAAKLHARPNDQEAFVAHELAAKTLADNEPTVPRLQTTIARDEGELRRLENA